MGNLAQNTNERPSGTSLVHEGRFKRRIAEAFAARGTTPACIVARTADTIELVVSALELDPDRIATDAMVDELMEANRLLQAVGAELAESAGDPELAVAISYASASSSAAAMMRALAAQGERHDRFVWTAMLTQLETDVLSPAAGKAASRAADKVRSGPVGARLSSEVATDEAAEE